MLTFDAESHKYFWDGKEVPGVSHILKTIGITRDYTGVDPFYRERGIHVHKAIQLYLAGKLDEDSLDSENVLPYFNAFRAFEGKFELKPLATEAMFCAKKVNGCGPANEFPKFAGTIDLYGKIQNKYTGIVDYKVTESSDKAADLQLLGYANLIYINLKEIPQFRIALELHGDGTYTPLFYQTPLTVWDSVMELYQWKITRRTKDLKEPIFNATSDQRQNAWLAGHD